MQRQTRASENKLEAIEDRAEDHGQDEEGDDPPCCKALQGKPKHWPLVLSFYLAFFLDAHQAFLACAMRFRAAALIVLRFGAPEVGPEDGPLGDLLAAHVAFIACEMRFLAAALIVLRFRGVYVPLGGLPRPRRPPSRAAMAALRRSRSALSSVTMLSCVKG